MYGISTPPPTYQVMQQIPMYSPTPMPGGFQHGVYRSQAPLLNQYNLGFQQFDVRFQGGFQGGLQGGFQRLLEDEMYAEDELVDEDEDEEGIPDTQDEEQVPESQSKDET